MKFLEGLQLQAFYTGGKLKAMKDGVVSAKLEFCVAIDGDEPHKPTAEEILAEVPKPVVKTYDVMRSPGGPYWCDVLYQADSQNVEVKLTPDHKTTCLELQGVPVELTGMEKVPDTGRVYMFLTVNTTATKDVLLSLAQLGHRVWLTLTECQRELIAESRKARAAHASSAVQ